MALDFLGISDCGGSQLQLHSLVWKFILPQNLATGQQCLPVSQL